MSFVAAQHGQLKVLVSGEVVKHFGDGHHAKRRIAVHINDEVAAGQSRCVGGAIRFDRQHWCVLG